MPNLFRVLMVGVVAGIAGYLANATLAPGAARAQAAEPGAARCAQWEVKVASPMIFTNSGVVAIEAGWEPFTYDAKQNRALIRRCRPREP